LLPPEDLPLGLPPEAIFIIITHDCDISQKSYDIEPWLEILAARAVKKIDGSLTFGKNPRKLHFSIKQNNEERYFEIQINEKFRTPRSCLENTLPGADCQLDRPLTHLIARWVGKRYTRPSFPDEFELRISAGDVRNKMKKCLTQYGTDILGIFIAVEQEEMPPEQCYNVILRAIISLEAAEDEGRETVAMMGTTMLQALLNQCAGINVIDAGICSVNEFTYEDMLNSSRWDYDYISAQQLPDETPKNDEI
jgi:hypothetical protein